MSTDLSPHETVRKLMERKDDIEAEIVSSLPLGQLKLRREGHRGRLEAEHSTMHSPLVTRDGFPRDDIDVLAVRTSRIRLLELRNDLQRVMDSISIALQQALPPSNDGPRASGSNGASGMYVDGPELTPFALVKSVDPAGPGAAAGVKADDQILSFGSVASENHGGLKALAGQVRKGERVEVELLRQGSRVRVGLVPRDGWGGRGLIGMHIVQL